jgi:hypothetical protein
MEFTGLLQAEGSDTTEGVLLERIIYSERLQYADILAP